MRRKPLGRDAALTARMVWTLAGLVVIYAGSLGYLGMFVLGWAIAGAPMIAALGLLAAGAVVVAFAVQASPARLLGARLVEPEEAPELHALLDRLCALADLPKPRVAAARSEMPAAFVTGLMQRTALLTVTRGLLARLNARELQAVLAHELAHVANRDGAVMTLAVFPSWAGSWVWRKLVGRWRYVLAIPFIWGYLLLGWIVHLFSRALMLHLSQLREFSADRGAAILTGDPAALMSALQKISGAMALIPRSDLRVVAGASALLVVPTDADDGTHPPLEERLERLGALARDLGEPLPPSSRAAVEVAHDAGREHGSFGTVVAVFCVTFGAVLAFLLAAQALAS